MKPNYRRCISCRKVDLKSNFWRIVRVYPSRQVQLDEGMGRSAYLCPQATCLETAQKKNRLGKTLRATVPPELYQALWQRLSNQPVQANPTTPKLSASDSAIDDGYWDKWTRRPGDKETREQQEN
ncbi:YlxR family protein [Phormidium sp. LEGE 05292]|uniref:YlxR family protein n=1 Tax=[Phormidium] sp. LEGE 05292 TaxID=767427 RepID=UPI0018825AEC|nr:YlxR family protein [Phormidium sp. LEGE 05292]MBE9224679.1 YlxR family protein [Phormidium sp. LEGE 05292]